MVNLILKSCFDNIYFLNSAVLSDYFSISDSQEKTAAQTKINQKEEPEKKYSSSILHNQVLIHTFTLNFLHEIISK